MIWTTTPWTLPANQALNLNPALVYALVDTDRGLLLLAETLVEKTLARYGLPGQVIATTHGGHLENVLTRDELVDNLMLYWLPGTGASAARLYWESIRQVNEWISGSTGDTVDVPTGCSVFPGELQRPSRRWAARRFTDIRYWNEPPRGGHFAAFEQPESYVNEIRSFFRTVR